MSTMTLEQKVYALLSQEDDTPFRRLHDKARDELGIEGYFDEHELDLMDWGMYYGVALALVLVDEPLAPLPAVALRAQRAAWTVAVVHGGGFKRNPVQATAEQEAAVRYGEAVAA